MNIPMYFQSKLKTFVPILNSILFVFLLTPNLFIMYCLHCCNFRWGWVDVMSQVFDNANEEDNPIPFVTVPC